MSLKSRNNSFKFLFLKSQGFLSVAGTEARDFALSYIPSLILRGLRRLLSSLGWNF